MPLNGKRDDFLRNDLVQVAREIGVKSGEKIIDEIIEAVSNWPVYAKDAIIMPTYLTEYCQENS